MAIQLETLFARAFFEDTPVRNATEAINRARDKFVAETRTDGLSFDAVAPGNLDEHWLREKLVHPLVYYCESEGRPLPRCAGVFISFFSGDSLRCISAHHFIEWATDELGVDFEQLRAQYGTQESDTGQH